MKKILKHILNVGIVGLCVCLFAACNNENETHTSDRSMPESTIPGSTMHENTLSGGTTDDVTKEPEDDTHPSSVLIKQDLQQQLSEHIASDFDCKMTVNAFNVEISRTEENSYYAEIAVNATSKYADFVWPVQVNYVKYDQGWRIERCAFGEYSYQQTRFPSESEMQELLQAQHLVEHNEKVDLVYSEEQIAYTSKCEATWSKFGSGSAVMVHRWNYSETADVWSFAGSTTQSGSFAITKELEGFWGTFMTSDYLTISNVQETSLEVKCGSVGPCQLSITGGSIYWTDDGCNLNITMKRGNTELSITLHDGRREYGLVTYDGIRMSFMGQGAEYYTVYIVYGEDSKADGTYSIGLKYRELDDETYEVAGIGSCTDEDIVIPSEYSGTPVTSIGWGAFEDTDITSITLPDSITHIETGAFDGCLFLKSIVIPDSVTSIGACAFGACFDLEYIVIPDSVTEVKNNIFEDWDSSQTIYFETLSEPQDWLYYDWLDGCKATIYWGDQWHYSADGIPTPH